MPGPAPKRSDQRRRVNKPRTPIVKVAGAAPAPPLGMEGLHPLAVAWYESLPGSPEAAYYTPAIWQRARLTAFTLSGALFRPSMSAPLWQALQNDMRDLLVSSAELRRLGIEVQASSGEDPDAAHADATVTELRALIGD